LENESYIDNSIYKVGIYLRLSREDEDKKNDFSESILNQKEFLTAYCLENGFSITDTYCDDGISRNNF